MSILKIKIKMTFFFNFKKLLVKRFLFSECLFQACWESGGNRQNGGELVLFRTGIAQKEYSSALLLSIFKF